MLLIGAFAALDHVRFPDLFPLLLRIRLLVVGVLGLVLWALARGRLERHVRVLGACCSIAIGLMFDVLMVFTGGAASPYYAGAGLVVLGANLTIPWAPAWSAFVSGVIVAGYAVCARPGGQPAPGHLFINNLFYLAGTGVIAIFTSAMHERLRWREFQTRRDLTDAYRQKSEFFANMSHELRTPIHVMIGYADIILEEALDTDPDEARRLVEASRRQGLLLNRLISDLLDYSKLEAGKMDLRLESVAIADAVGQIAESFRPVAEHKGLRLTMRADGDLPALVTDRYRVQQILNNLVGNAIKFTATGEVRIEVVSATAFSTTDGRLLTLGQRLDGPPAEGIAIAITDTGIGIREADLAKLANDFQQLDDAVLYGGTGLGLSFCRKLATILGGVIAVRSKEGAGSTFVAFLPVRAPGSVGDDTGRRLRHRKPAASVRVPSRSFSS